jgi:hypothetical protein
MRESDDFCGSAWDWFVTALTVSAVFVVVGVLALVGLALVIWTVNHV